MLTGLRPLLFPGLIAALVVLAAFGVRQVIVGQEAPGQPPFPLTTEEARRLFEGDLQSEEEARDLAGRVRDWNQERSRASVEEFAATGQDPCSLPFGELVAEPHLPYADIAALANDVDLIAVGRPSANSVRVPDPNAGGAPILTTLELAQTLKGNAGSQAITVESGQYVALDAGQLTRLAVHDADLCTPGDVLLFLKGPTTAGAYSYPLQGWVRFDGDAVHSGELGESSSLFITYGTRQEVIAAIQAAVEHEQVQDAPRGALLCESKRTSERFQDPIVCPGDVFNPYQTFQLDKGVLEAYVLTSAPGPSPRIIARADLAPGGDQLTALLAALDSDVAMEPLASSDDLITLTVSPMEPLGTRDNFTFGYSPSQSIIQMSISGGQFSAPPAFVEAMAPFLATASDTAQ